MHLVVFEPSLTDSGLSLPSISEKSKRRTKTVINTCDPHWNQSFIYSPLRPADLRLRVLEVTVWDYDRFGANEFLGEVTIDLGGAHQPQGGGGGGGAVVAAGGEPLWHVLNTYRNGAVRKGVKAW